MCFKHPQNDLIILIIKIGIQSDVIFCNFVLRIDAKGLRLVNCIIKIIAFEKKELGASSAKTLCKCNTSWG